MVLIEKCFFKERGKLLLTFEGEKLAQPQAFLVGSKNMVFSLNPESRGVSFVLNDSFFVFISLTASLTYKKH